MPVVGRAAAGLPRGGTSGQALLKTSDVDYAVGWGPAPAAGGGIGPIHAVGSWYDNRVNGGIVSAANTGGVAIGQNQVWYLPVYLPSTVRIDAFAFLGYTATAGFTVTVGISSATAAGLPGTVLATTSVSPGATDSTYVSPLGSTVTVPAGWAYLSVGSNAGVTYPACAATTAFAAAPVGLSAAQFNWGPAAFQQTASAVPTNNPTTNLLTSAATLPVLWYRVGA